MFIHASLYHDMSHLSYEHDVCESVHLSVTLADCDHIMQQVSGNRHMTG